MDKSDFNKWVASPGSHTQWAAWQVGAKAAFSDVAAMIGAGATVQELVDWLEGKI